jgi:lipopolysaccharide export system permease protein
MTNAVERTMAPNGDIVTRALPADAVVIHETLSDFLEVHRESEELSYRALHRHIRQLREKGIDPSSYLVDLNLKLAVPFASFVLACIAVPLGGRVQRHPSIAAILGTGLVIGFGYWVILALTNALGQSGTLPAFVAAWAANVICLLLAAVLFLSTE